MNDLTIFQNPDFGQVRTIAQDGEPWFVAADVCGALELSDTSKAIRRLDDDEKGTNSIRTPGGPQDMIIVNEPGLYTLILGSRKPEAKAFKRWITHEVLPTLRKAGSYTMERGGGTVERRTLTSDDYLRAASVIATCRNERLPYVFDLLTKGGWEIPRLLNKERDAPEGYESVAEAITDARMRGIRVNQLAAITGVDRVQLWYYRTGRNVPKKDRAQKIMSAIVEAVRT